MKPCARVPLAGLALAAGSLFLVTTAPPAAPAVTASQAPGKPNKPNKPNKPDKPDRSNKGPKKPDRRAPAAPSLGSAFAGSGGSISVPVVAESGSRVVVRERGGGVVASGTGSQTYSWSTSTGAHSYLVTATDPAGNRSPASRFAATADAIPPAVSSMRLDAGDRSDTRSRLTFLTEPGAALRVYVDGRLERARFAADSRVAMLLDVANGRHTVRVESRDRVRNATTLTRVHRVRIAGLRLSTEVVSDPTVNLQRVRVVTSPSAKRGVVRVPGRPPERFALFRGSATLRLTLDDGTHEGIRVQVRDGSGRLGRRTLDPVRVDTTRPPLALTPSGKAAADGQLGAAVTTAAGTSLAWRLIDGADQVVTSGRLAPVDGSGAATIERDVAEGSYRLVVSATDEFGRVTTTSEAVEVGPDPVPTGRLAAAVVAVIGGGLALGLLAVPLYPRLLRRVTRARARLTAWQIDRSYERAQLLWDEPEQVPPQAAVDDSQPPPVAVPQQRSRRRAAAALHQGEPRLSLFDVGFALEPDERVLHTTAGQLYETTPGDVEELVLDGHAGEIVVTNRRIVFVGDVTREWRAGLIDKLRHVGDEQSVVQRWQEESWAGLVYDDADVTRLYLDLVVAEQHGHRRDDLARLAEEVRATEG